MNEIICPHCNKVFKVDEAGFADILKQVRDHRFEEEIQQRLAIAEKEKENAIKLAEANLRNSLQENLVKKDKEIIALQAKNQQDLSLQLAEKTAEIAEMLSKIQKAELETKLKVTEAVQKIEKERDSLANDLKTKELEKQNLESSLKHQYSTELQSKDAIIKYKDDEIARVKDMKLKLSTKMIGETLEQHCEIEFNKLRATAFQKAYFEKDNDSKSGSKGDFIYKESDDSGNEIISIMFEMKNEGDETATKKRNEDFLKELDKDRTEKKCEYEAVDIYLADLQTHTRSKTHQSYQSKLRYFVDENVSKQLNEIDSNELKRFIRNRINKVQNIKIHREGTTFELNRKIAWTNNTVRSARGIFRAFFNWCINEGYYKQANPMSKVPLKEIHSENQSNQRNVPFSAEDNSKIMKYLDENDQPIAFFCRFLSTPV